MVVLSPILITGGIVYGTGGNYHAGIYRGGRYICSASATGLHRLVRHTMGEEMGKLTAVALGKEQDQATVKAGVFKKLFKVAVNNINLDAQLAAVSAKLLTHPSDVQLRIAKALIYVQKTKFPSTIKHFEKALAVLQAAESKEDAATCSSLIIVHYLLGLCLSIDVHHADESTKPSIRSFLDGRRRQDIENALGHIDAALAHYSKYRAEYAATVPYHTTDSYVHAGSTDANASSALETSQAASSSSSSSSSSSPSPSSSSSSASSSSSSSSSSSVCLPSLYTLDLLASQLCYPLGRYLPALIHTQLALHDLLDSIHDEHDDIKENKGDKEKEKEKEKEKDSANEEIAELLHNRALCLMHVAAADKSSQTDADAQHVVNAFVRPLIDDGIQQTQKNNTVDEHVIETILAFADPRTQLLELALSDFLSAAISTDRFPDSHLYVTLLTSVLFGPTSRQLESAVTLAPPPSSSPKSFSVLRLKSPLVRASARGVTAARLSRFEIKNMFTRIAANSSTPIIVVFVFIIIVFVIVFIVIAVAIVL